MGISNYHGLQAEFRQRLNHGMQFNANYTLLALAGGRTGERLSGQRGRIVPDRP